MMEISLLLVFDSQPSLLNKKRLHNVSPLRNFLNKKEKLLTEDNQRTTPHKQSNGTM